MRKKWIKLFPLLIGAVIAYCLLWYVIPQNKGGEVAAILVAAILLFFFILEEFYKLKYCSTVVYMVPRA